MRRSIIAYLLALLAFGSAPASASGESCVTATCHVKTIAGKYLHGALEDGDCAGCHTAAKGATPYQAGSQHKFTKVAVPQSCVECHEEFKGEVVHDPVKEGDCLGCHNPHAANQKRLLVTPFLVDWFGDHGVDDYKLCMDCHDAGGFSAPTTTDATGFRNGTRNLHYLHLQGAPRSRSCLNCHNVHAAGKHLLPEAVRFNGFDNLKIPINFQATENGGSCQAGCHQQSNRGAYDRLP